MIFDHLSNHSRYAGLGPRFQAAFAFLTRQPLADLPEGSHEIISGEVTATVSVREPRAAATAPFEVHRRFADIHLCLAAEDRIAWNPGQIELTPLGPFDESRDSGKFSGDTRFQLPVRGDAFAIVFPGEEHAPLIGEGGMLRKLVVKVLID